MIYRIVVIDFKRKQFRAYMFQARKKPADVLLWLQEHDKKWNDTCKFIAGIDVMFCYMDRETGECLVEEDI